MAIIWVYLIGGKHGEFVVLSELALAEFEKENAGSEVVQAVLQAGDDRGTGHLWPLERVLREE